MLRDCLRIPIPEIAATAQLLDEAVTAHLRGDRAQAETLFLGADLPILREWTESVWGRNSPHVQYAGPSNVYPAVAKGLRSGLRMPTGAEKRALRERDGFHCRFCGIPVIRSEVRSTIRRAYPSAVRWGRTNTTQHAAFQTMWLQYDHLVPHARGGTNDIANMVIACAACNFGRMNYTLDEVGVSDPFARKPVVSGWDGLERFR
jgi:5-methylcytosine-specific restriction endonuclease McrA